MNDNHPCVRPRVAEPSRSNENEGGLTQNFYPRSRGRICWLSAGCNDQRSPGKAQSCPMSTEFCYYPFAGGRGEAIRFVCVCVCLCVSELGIPVA